MLRITVSLLVLVLYPVTAASADKRYCGHASELASARLRWEAARRGPIDPVYREKSCRTYAIQFYEAVTTRQAISVCSGGNEHQRELRLLDSEIDAFNNLIAAQCGS